MSKIEVDTIAPQSGTNVNLGESGDTVTVPAGVTFDASNATTTLPSTVVTTTGTQTLTNKTIDADNNTITNIANAGIKSGAAIDYSKLNLTGNIALADLSATGTKDSTTFLRGDNTFAEAGGGLVLQVVSTAKTDTYSEIIAANTMSSTNITGLSASITPSSSSNKILIMASLAIGRSSNDANSGVGVAMFRDGSLVGVGDSAGSRTRLSSMSFNSSDITISTIPINYLDSPATTSSITYTFRFLNSDGDTSGIYLNRSADDSNGSYIGRCISTVTLMEISV